MAKRSPPTAVRKLKLRQQRVIDQQRTFTSHTRAPTHCPFHRTKLVTRPRKTIEYRRLPFPGGGGRSQRLPGDKCSVSGCRKNSEKLFTRRRPDRQRTLLPLCLKVFVTTNRRRSGPARRSNHARTQCSSEAGPPTNLTTPTALSL